MKKVLFSLVLAVALLSCGSAYNSALKQVELGMTQDQIISMMGNKYNVVDGGSYNNQTIEYKDRYKNNWNFEFVDGYLTKWYKITDQ